MGVFRSSARLPTRRADMSSERLHLAGHRRNLTRTLGIAGVVACNWWAVVPFTPGLMTSPHGFFSDLEVFGSPGAELMQHADFAAGILMDAAS